MESLTRRLSLADLQNVPPIVRKLDLAQLIVDASGTPVAAEAQALLESPEEEITAEAVFALCEKLHNVAIPA